MIILAVFNGFCATPPAGSLDPCFDAYLQDSRVDVLAVAQQADGRVLIGGEFKCRAGDGINRVARLQPDGTVDLSFQPGTDGTVRALAVQPDGKVLMGGAGFAGSDGRPYSFVRLTWGGQPDPGFVRNAPLPEMVRAIVLQPDDKILVGGGSYGVNERCLARLKPDGTLDLSFVPPPFPAGDEFTVHALALTTDGKILVGGELGYENSPLPRTIARLNPNGTLDDTFHAAEALASGVVRAFAVQPDGRILVGGQLIVGDEGRIAGLVRLAADGTLDSTFQPPNEALSVQALALQPDGKILVGTASGGLFRLLAGGQFDRDFRSELGFTDGTAEITSVLLQPDGLLLVTGSFRSVSGIPRKGIARLHNDLDANQPEVLWARESAPGSALAFSPDGTMLAATGAGISLWRVGDGTLERHISGAFGGLGSVTFAPDSLRLAAGDGDGKVYVWNRWDGSRVWSWKAAGDVTSVLFTPDGTLASWSSDQATIAFWKTDDGTSLGAWAGHQWSHHNVAISPDGTTVAIGGDEPDCQVRLLRATDGQIIRSMSGHSGRVRTVAFSTDGDLLASGSDDTTIRLWRATDGAALRVLTGHSQGIWKIALAPNGTLASASDDGTLRLWRIRDGTLLRSYPIGGVGGPEVEFSPDGSLLAYSAGDRLVVARNPVPAITTQPHSQTRFAGQNAEFQVIATGLLPLYYQWHRDGIPLAYSVDPVLSIPLLSPADAGVYSVTVSNALGVATSKGAILNVLSRTSGGDLLDATFDASAGGILLGPAGGSASVNALALQPDGRLLLAGDFLAFNGILRNRIARLHPDHSLDETFDPGLGPDKAIEAMALQQGGKILIGGTFTIVDGRPRSGLARLLADGSLDPVFKVDVIHANVGFLGVEADGGIWVGGNFSSIAGIPRRNLARLRADGSLDESFTPPAITAGDYDNVNWVQRLPDGRILVGGHFESQRPLGGSDQDLVRLQSDGTVDSTFNCELSGMFLSDGVVRPDRSILVGGMLHSWMGGSHYFVLAELQPDGHVAREYSPETLPALVTSVLLQPDGKPIIGGMFDTAYQAPRRGVARLHVDGSLDADFDSSAAFPSAADPEVLALCLQPDGRIWAGAMDSSRNEAAQALAVLGPDGRPEPGFGASLSGESGVIGTLVQEPDGKILVAGAFTRFHQQPRTHLARLHPNGTLDYSFDPAVSPNLWILALLRQPDGRLLVAGKVDGSTGPPGNGIVRLNPDGAVDPTFDATPAADGACGHVRCLALQPDGKILIGGEFDLPPRGLARLNPDGSADPGFRPPPVPAWDEEGVHAVAVLASGRILIGGDLVSIEGGLPSNLARLNPDGSVDPTFALGVVLHGCASPIVPTGDGHWLVGGLWVDDGAGSRRTLLKLNADGNLERLLAVPGYDYLRPLAVEATGHILVGGVQLRRLNPDGSMDPGFWARPSLFGNIDAVLVQADSRIVVGGQFSSINGMPAHNLARLNPAPPPRLPFVERQVGPQAQVRLLAQPPAGTTRYSVQDGPSWAPIQSISHGGSFDPATGWVTFGPFNDAEPRVLSYSVVIPPGSAGWIHFQGTATADGLTGPILGDASLRIWEFPPPPFWVEMRARPLSQGLVLQVWGQPNKHYTIESSNDLGDWETVGTVSSPDGLSEFNVATPTAAHRFYRVQTAE